MGLDSIGGSVDSMEAGKRKNSNSSGNPARFWLRLFFRIAESAPWLLRMLKRPVVWGVVRCSPSIRHATAMNAKRLLGPNTTKSDCGTFAAKVVGCFYDIVIDIAKSGRLTVAQLRSQIDSIEGHEEFLATRADGKGAIILTAHMGSFEVGLSALAELEPQIHVVFKRDEFDQFETIRRRLRATLGVHEAAIDEGLDTWLRLRGALESNQVVVMQGDRAMPGQKAQVVPICGGHLLLPLGPIKLAQISGSPIIPVFCIRTKSGRCRLFVERAIRVEPDAQLVNGVHPQLLKLGKVIEKYITAYSDQWLVLEPAFIEDSASSST
jgi:KDO2-lipid IV(A) lauroyltransferase